MQIRERMLCVISTVSSKLAGISTSHTLYKWQRLGSGARWKCCYYEPLTGSDTWPVK